MFQEDLVYTVALNKVFKYNPKASNYLLQIFGSVGGVFEAIASGVLSQSGKGNTLIDKLSDKNLLDWADNEINWARSKGIKLLCLGEPEYPKLLKECNDPPLLLYVYGDLDFNKGKFLSVVGTRMVTEYGKSSCRKIVRDFYERGFSPVIVSGLAYGADITAHRAALEYGLKTIAVLPNGLDKIYPAAHHEAARQISRQGAIVTEFPRESESLKLNFIQRNRIIAGLSEATIVIESREKGGALTTANLALSYDRGVFALPGRIYDVFSAGCNNLIYNNVASVYRSVDDLVTSLGWSSDISKEDSSQRDIFYLADPEKEKILLALSSNFALSMDEIHLITGEKLQNLTKKLLELELDGKILSLPGNRYSLA